jgi:hypothetical protein
MEQKDFKFAVDEIDAEAGTFTGYASTFGEIDLVGEIVVRGAFKKTLQEKPHFPLNWVHDASHPLGIVRLDEDKRGLKVAGELNMDVQSAREKRSLMKQGAITGMSIGYDIIKDGHDEATGARLLKELKLYEISLCEFPACPSAQVLTVKAVEPTETKELDALPDLEPDVVSTLEVKSQVIAEPESIHSLKTYAEVIKEIRESIERGQ